MQTNHAVPLRSLTTGRVELREVRLGDYEVLYSMMSVAESHSRWRFRGSTPSPEEFRSLLWRGVVAQFVVVRRSTSETMGLLTAFDADFANGTAHLAALYDIKVQGLGWPMEGYLVFLDYVFSNSNWPFRKLYAESIDFNAATFGRGMSKYFVEEGRLRGHEYFNGKYWDVVITALYRRSWEERRRRYAGSVLPGTAGES